MLKVLGPGGDVSTSAGKVTCETPWKFPGGLDQPWRQMEGEPLELNGQEATHAVHTSGFWICKGTLSHLNEDGLGNKGIPGG